MLLRAGMSAKQAIIYNCLSSILCFFGMLIGVAIGNIHESSLWIFAAVGGMFLYICLVDMVSYTPPIYKHGPLYIGEVTEWVGILVACFSILLFLLCYMECLISRSIIPTQQAYTY